jgi:hypothetical protein
MHMTLTAPLITHELLCLRQAARMAKGFHALSLELTMHVAGSGEPARRHWSSQRAFSYFYDPVPGLGRVLDRLASHWRQNLGERIHEPPVPCGRIRRHQRSRWAAVVVDLSTQRDLWCWQISQSGYGVDALKDWLCLQPDGAYRLTADAAPRLAKLAECFEAEILQDLAWLNSLEEVHAHLPLGATQEDASRMRNRLNSRA